MPPQAELVKLPGIEVAPDALRLPRSQAILQALLSGHLAFAKFVECKATSEPFYQETVVMEVEVERPQLPAADIRRVERVGAVLEESDDFMPRVLALRTDFPEVIHLNQEAKEIPRSLCLYDQPWRELRLSWTAPAFIERIRDWLKRTAFGELHEADQPLEPILLGTNHHLILPSDLINEQDGASRLDLTLAWGSKKNVLIACPVDDEQRTAKGGRHVATVVECPPREHRVLGRTPSTLKDLVDLLAKVDIDLLGALRSRLQGWDPKEFGKSTLVLVLLLPKIRQAGGPVEEIDHRAFWIPKSIPDIGIDIGLWDRQDGHCVPIVGGDASRKGANTPVGLANLHMMLTQGMAAVLNGVENIMGVRFTAVGAGALGSQVLLNLTRAGYRPWAIIDEDVVLPHNLARHGLAGFALGVPKAEALALTLDSLLEGDQSRAVVADILRPGEQVGAVKETLENADVILDLAASVAVSRHLAHYPAPGRRISFFLSPSGRDLVLIAEDLKREFRLDWLEMQYYRALWEDSRLRDHFTAVGRPVRYGQSCRDLSARVPQDLVAIHAGIAARAFKGLQEEKGPVLRIWKIDQRSAAVEAIDLPVAYAQTRYHGEWNLVVDTRVMIEAQNFSSEKPGTETGGILVGAHDMTTRTVYVVAALPSPADSIEWPNLYIRGCHDLTSILLSLREVTGQALGYIGEWHSHPEGCPAKPGKDDRQLLGWLAERMAPEGKPPLMMIVSDVGVGFFP